MSQDRQKQLQSQIAQLQKKLDSLKQSRGNLDNEISTTVSKLQRVEQDLKRISHESKEPVVSEHAIIRYLERVKKIDIEQIKREILTDDIKKYIEKLNSGKFPEKNFMAVVRKKIVITIIPKDI